MKIVCINTDNKIVAKDMLIKAAIKSGMQYVEMEDEVLIDGNTLVRFKRKEEVNSSSSVLFFERAETLIPHIPVFSIRKYIKDNDKYRIDFKKESRIVKQKIKANQCYKKRGYR